MDTTDLWNRYSNALRTFIFKKVKDEELSKDLLQEVFIKVHLHRNKLRQKEKAKAWLYSIATNVVMDFFKEQSFSHRLPQIEAEPESPEEHKPADCLRPLINNLPDSYKEAVILSEIEGKKQSEVAKLLRISLSGAKSRIQRGRKLLQNEYMGCCNYTLSEKGVLTGEDRSIHECKVCG